MAAKVLLIIDVQDGFTKTKEAKKAVDYISSKLIPKKWDKVIQSRWENHMGSRYETDLGYCDVGDTKGTGMLVNTPGDHVITRTCYSCFCPKLEALVSKEDEIYVCGLETDACVLATLFDLWDNGYKFFVYSGGVATNAKDLQKPTLHLIARQFGKGVLI